MYCSHQYVLVWSTFIVCVVGRNWHLETNTKYFRDLTIARDQFNATMEHRASQVSLFKIKSISIDELEESSPGKTHYG